MPDRENVPVEIEKCLRQLGVDRVDDIRRVRASLAEIASMGTPLLPDFTLHNEQHSDNLILLLGRLRTGFGLKLGHYEAFLLAAAAYLHDLGMFFDGATFEETILPDPKMSLPLCPEARCDAIENYQLFGRDTGGQIRETHNLLSAYWLYRDVTPIAGVTEDDKPYLMAICRGHGRANLKERRCRCYETVQYNAEEIRVGLLAALLRLVDAMDFYKNRAPATVFRKNAAALLRDPVSLGHWIKHYFVQAPFIAKVNKGGNPILECIVYVAVPAKAIGTVRYTDFLRPLFEEHIEEAQRWDFDINQYPPELAIALGCTGIKMLLDERELAGARDLPDRITREIEQTSCGDVLEFLEQLTATVEQDHTTGERKAASEVREAPVLRVAAAGTSLRSTSQTHRMTLLQVLVTRFNDGELRTLCFGLNVDYDDLPDSGKANKARELISYLDRRDRIRELIEVGKQLRPDINWEDILPVSSSKPVLIVEDHVWYRQYLVTTLTEAGYWCDQAGTYDEALNKLGEYSPLVLLLDVKLNGQFRGWDLARIAVGKGVPIIVVTGYPSVEGVNKAIRDFDAVYFFDKSSLSPGELTSKVSEVESRTHKRRLTREQRLRLFETLLGFFPDSSSGTASSLKP